MALVGHACDGGGEVCGAGEVDVIGEVGVGNNWFGNDMMLDLPWDVA